MSDTRPTFLRRRLIPLETVKLADDIILYRDEDIIVTKWRALHPKPSLCRGLSCYFLKEGYKVSTKDFIRIGIPFTIVAAVTGAAVVWLVWA